MHPRTKGKIHIAKINYAINYTKIYNYIYITIHIIIYNI